MGPVDGALGPVKGLRRRERVVAELTIHPVEFVVDNLVAAIPGANSTNTDRESIQNEYVDEGDGVNDTFTLENTNVLAGTYRVYIGTTAAVPVLQVEGAGNDYTIVLATGVITFTAGSIPAVGEHVIVDYQYDGGAGASDASITGGLIEAGDYLTSIALLGTCVGRTNPVVCILSNPLVVTPFELELASPDEAVLELTFQAHFDPAAMGTEPWEIRYPTA
jgi:hypothetical protein